MIDRSVLGDGMHQYCEWNTGAFLPASIDENDAFSINPQGSIIESIYFHGNNDDYRDDKGQLMDIYPEFKLIVGKNDAALQDRSSNTVLNNPYEIMGAWTHTDYLNSLAGVAYQSWHTTCKGFHGMMLLTVTEVRSCTISNFAGHGVYIVGNNFQNNDFTELNRLHIHSNNGNGLHIYGGDAGLVTSLNLSSTTNAGWGILHCGTACANTFISCQASYNNKGGYLAPESVYMPTTDVQEPDLRTAQDILNGIVPPALLPMPQLSFSGSGIQDVSAVTDPLPVNSGVHGSGALFLGCYAESNWSTGTGKNIADDNFINYRSVLIGCTSTLGGYMAGHPANLQKLGDDSLTPHGALTGFGRRATDIGINPANYTKTTIGSSTYNNVALSFTNVFEEGTDPWKYDNFNALTTLVLQYDERNYWAFKSSANLHHSPLSLSTYHNTDVGEAQVWLEKGLFLGYSIDPYSLNDVNKRIRILTSTPDDLQKTISSYGITEEAAKPGKGKDNMYRWEEGDIILNKKPKAGGNTGWICCIDPKDSLLKWYPYGEISGKSITETFLGFKLARLKSNTVNDIAGNWQYEGGIVMQLNGQQVGHYSSQKRVTHGGTTVLNTASVTTTLFFNSKDNNVPDNITLQGAHDFSIGNKCGSVSSASKKYQTTIGKTFNQFGNILIIN